MSAVALPTPGVWVPSPDGVREWADTTTRRGRDRLRRWKEARRSGRDTVLEAIALDQPIGTGKGHASTTATFTTTATVAAGTHILLVAGRFNSASANTQAVSGGALTWVEDATLSAGNLRVSVFRAVAAAGLVSGTTLTLTHSGSSPASTDSIFGGGSFTGIDTVGTVVTTGTNNASTAGWSASCSSTSGNALFGGAFMDGATTSSTPTAPGVELFDVNDATQTETETGVYKLSVAGADSIAGTWLSAAAWAAAVVCYKAAAAATGFVRPKIHVSREAHRRSTRW